MTKVKKNFIERHAFIGFVIDMIVFIGTPICLVSILPFIPEDYFLPLFVLILSPVYTLYVNILRPNKKEQMQDWADYFEINVYVSLALWIGHSTIGLVGARRGVVRVYEGPIWEMGLGKAFPLFVLEGSVVAAWFLLYVLGKKFQWKTTKFQPEEPRNYQTYRGSKKRKKKKRKG